MKLYVVYTVGNVIKFYTHLAPALEAAAKYDGQVMVIQGEAIE